MDKFDFPKTVEPPKLKALENSFTVNDEEKELRDLFIQVFRETLSAKVYDLNVSGATHLGSFESIKHSINADGLTILQGDREESATRYLYRAWQARDRNGRGMHFLRTYLHLLYPNACQVAQIWQDKDKEYTKGMHSVLEMDSEGNAYVPDPEKQWLTSRLEIALDLTVTNRSITTLTSIFRAILPARLVPQFRFWMKFETALDIRAEWYLFMHKDTDTFYPYCGLVITDRPNHMWHLGLDGDPEAPKLKQCRVQTTGNLFKDVETDYDRTPRVGQKGRYVDGTWNLPKAPHVYATFELNITK